MAMLHLKWLSCVDFKVCKNVHTFPRMDVQSPFATTAIQFCWVSAGCVLKLLNLRRYKTRKNKFCLFATTAPHRLGSPDWGEGCLLVKDYLTFQLNSVCEMITQEEKIPEMTLSFISIWPHCSNTWSKWLIGRWIMSKESLHMLVIPKVVSTEYPVIQGSVVWSLVLATWKSCSSGWKLTQNS